MIPALDSAAVPIAAEVAQAKAAGVKMWSGYLATQSGVNLLNPWPKAGFDVVRVLPAKPIAFCSGWDNPVMCRQLAAQWDVRLCLDVESGIRGDGLWVQPWLDASGAGLYGNLGVHAGRTAAFHVLASYPGLDPRATWLPWSQPTGPLGWQWQGSHTEFGVDVDRAWFDDWFLDPPKEDDMPKLYQGTNDQTTNGNIWLSDLVWKRLVPTSGELAIIQQNLIDTTVHIIQQEVLDNVKDAAAVQGPAGPSGPPGPATLAAHTHPLAGSTGESVAG